MEEAVARQENDFWTRLLFSWPFAMKRQFPGRFQLLFLKAVDQTCSLVKLSVQSGCSNKACRLGSVADGVEKREGKEKSFLKHLHSVQPVGLNLFHVMLLLQESHYGLDYLSNIYNILLCNNRKESPTSVHYWVRTWDKKETGVPVLRNQV